MKKIFGIVMLVLLFVGFSATATPPSDFGTVQLEYTISPSVSVSAVTVETPSVVVFVDVESPAGYEITSYEQLKVEQVAPPLLEFSISDVSTAPPPLLTNKIDIIPLFKSELINLETNAEDVEGLITVPLNFGSNVATTNLFEVLFEPYI